MARLIHEIAEEIRENWPKIYFGAKPYLDAMKYLNTAQDYYGYDRADDIVQRFLLNARSWRGDTARRIKAELKALIA